MKTNANEQKEIIKATQKSLISSMRQVLKEMKEELGMTFLTIDTFDELLKAYENKEVTITFQHKEM